MSSENVRSAVNKAVRDATLLAVYDLSDYVSIEEALPNDLSQCVLVQYVSATEDLQSIGGEEGNQCWEEGGTVVIHIAVPSGFQSRPTVQEADSIRSALRGKRLTSEITVQSVTPFVDFGVAEGRRGSWHMWAADVYYIRRFFGDGIPVIPSIDVTRIIGTGDIRITGDGDYRIIKEAV